VPVDSQLRLQLATCSCSSIAVFMRDQSQMRTTSRDPCIDQYTECCAFYSFYLSIIFILSVKRSHHIRREDLEILTLIQKREEYTPLDFVNTRRSRLIQRIHKFGITIRKSKEFIFNTNTITKFINSELKIRKILVT
jgi:hypothetical protein